MDPGQLRSGASREAALLSATDLKPHLLHEDRLVRDAIVEYFKDSWSQDPELVPIVLEAVRRYGPGESRVGLAACPQFLLTEESLDGALAAMAEFEGEIAAFHLNATIARAPADLLTRHHARILDAPGLLPEAADRVHRRRELSTWPAAKLWSELEELARRSAQRYVGQIDHAYADDLIDILSGHAEPDVARVCEILGPDGPEDWLEIFAIDLAGARQLGETIPSLIDKFRIDTDYMLERAARALARIGDPSAVHRIRSVFASEGWNFRNYSSGVLAAIKSQASEEALLALLSTERDKGIRAWLCLGLCEQFSQRGLSVVLKEIASGYDERAVSLTEEVLPVAELLGVELPEADAWRERAERERDRLENHDFDLTDLPPDQLPNGDERGFLVDSPLPYRRAHPKIGRNAPCPCGSGRKFKKCCGDATA